MITARIAELLQHLKVGVFDPADAQMLEQMSVRQLVDELRSVYHLTFQERHVGAKWEVSLARSVRAELAARPVPGAVFVSFLLVPAYRDCVLLNAEDDSVTGISRLARLTAWPVKKPEKGLALKSASGFKLDRTPDGWAIKPMRRRVVRLSERFLRDRGWRFDHLKQFIPIP